MDDKPKTQPRKAGKILLEELTGGPPDASRGSRLRQVLLVPILAVVTGLLLGGLFIVLTSEEGYAAFGQGSFNGLGTSFVSAGPPYPALFTGSIGDPARIVTALQSGDALAIRRAFNPILESLVASTPYIFGGLAVALGFQCGLFNIGVEGQIFVGAILAAFAGYSITGVPAFLHLPLALLAGALGGAIWGFIPRWLQAKTGGG